MGGCVLCGEVCTVPVAAQESLYPTFLGKSRRTITLSAGFALI